MTTRPALHGGRIAAAMVVSGGRQVLIENKYAVIAAVAAFLVVLWLSGGSMFAAFGALAFIAGIGWAVRRIFGNPR